MALGKLELMAKYPQIFVRRPPFGLEVSPGWLDMLDELFGKIQALIDSGDVEEIAVLQIKSKFRGLRFYYAANGPGTEKLSTLVRDYEVKSLTICERCGKPGEERVISGWYWTMCNTCFQEKRTDIDIE